MNMEPHKSLKQIKKEAEAAGVSVQKLCKKAGLPWQSFYRKLHKPKLLKLHEYDKLIAALDKLRAEPRV